MIPIRAEVHIWLGLKPPIYKGLKIIPMMGPSVKFKPGFKSANDEKGGKDDPI